ncbi:MAG: sigma-70 family RNA polymerase sigma factor [Planctomycetes bacterium]|nr:sigma-70 family RNA polymerase sigma factor [Planctomycetota bacterium]
MMVDQDELVAHLRGMRSIAIAIVGLDESETVLSSVFLKAIQKPPRHSKNIRAWLATMIKNEAIDCVRSTSRRIAREQRLPVAELPSTPPELLEKAETRTLIQAALMSMPEPQRHILILRYYEDLSPREIGLKFNISHGTARTRISRALGALREKMRKRSGDNKLNACLIMLGMPKSLLAPKPLFTIPALSAVISAASLLAIGSVIFTPDNDNAKPKTSQSIVGLSESSLSPPLMAATRHLRATAQRELSVQLIDDHQQLITNARVTLFQDATTCLGVLKNNGNGSFIFPDSVASDSESIVLVTIPGRAPLLSNIDFSKINTQRISVTNGRLFSGKVNFASKHRPRALFISLELNNIRPAPGTVAFALRNSLSPSQAEIVDKQFELCSVKVDDEGQFGFWGLPDYWSGELRLASGIYKLAESTMRLDIQRIEFYAPSEGVVLFVEEFPSVSGVIQSQRDAQQITRFLSLGDEQVQVQVSDSLFNKETGEFKLYFYHLPSSATSLVTATDRGQLHFGVNNFSDQYNLGDLLSLKSAKFTEPSQPSNLASPKNRIHRKKLSGTVIDAQGKGVSNALLMVKNNYNQWRLETTTLAYGKFNIDVFDDDTSICARVVEGSHANSLHLRHVVSGDVLTLKILDSKQRQLIIGPLAGTPTVTATRSGDGLPIRSGISSVDNNCYVSFYCTEEDVVKFVIQDDCESKEIIWTSASSPPQ